MISHHKRSWTDAGVWWGAAIGVCLFHLSLLLLLTASIETPAPDEPAGAVVVELSDTPVAEANLPEQVQPGPLQIESKAVSAPEPVPEKTQEQPVLPVSDAPDAEQQDKPEPPKEKPEEQSVGQIAMAPQVQAEKLGTAAAAQQGSTVRVETDATPKWIGKISVLLERQKRYPEAARRRREAGVTAVAFSVNRSGQVLTSRILQSSGSAVLDNEALATLMRVQPLPQVPAGIHGDTVDVTISLRFEHN